MTNKPLIGAAAVVVVLAAAGIYYLHGRDSPQPVPTPALLPEPPAEPAIEHPLPADEAKTPAAGPLPTLADSDSSLRDVLAHLVGAASVQNYLLPENIVRHIVVTIDNLPRQKVAVEKRPIAPIPGPFVADGDELHATIDARNAERYRPLVAVIGKLDMQQLAAVYIRYYPLFQEAYQNLGYPTGYFNDRLVQVIDVMLAAPQPAGGIDLVRPNVMYLFADPALEARPAGQKLLIRMGPENAAVIKAKLMELRAIVTKAPPKH